MPPLFSQTDKITLIEYGSEAREDFSWGAIKAFFKRSFSR